MSARAKSRLTSALDTVLDRSLVLGYSRVGPALRRRWWPADPEPGCLAGQRVVVTGATSGIGEAMVTSFARLGATVHVLGRNPDKVRRVVAEVREALPGADLVEEVCDVGDLDVVRAWCADLTDRLGAGGALRGIVHNAGAMVAERTETAQGHELALAVHVLGPHLMTERLLPLLGADAGGPGGPGSVVWMSSGGMYSAGLRSTPDEIEFRPVEGEQEYSGVRGYARTKRMQVELADAWNDRPDVRPGVRPGGGAGAGVRVESCHPGWAATPGVTDSLPGFDTVMGPLLRDAASGADTAVWLVATRPASAGTHHFWHDRRPRPTTYPVQRRPDPVARRAFLDHVAAATGTVWP
ncbi:SDR family NAD(P)-dependent oxidoreductase [Nocardioides dongxiaopingii]|uniref:SDR family NAD(P)-dependent oxidoreductase n=1 Tax=Nocardioides dongxiaopingii TaxID=2576036 RepID=UPI0010C76779|nr:SDR family NAD(P)-dependent oxidoreductase [Nocardioides dongxiaopingii]